MVKFGQDGNAFVWSDYLLGAISNYQSVNVIEAAKWLELGLENARFTSFDFDLLRTGIISIESPFGKDQNDQAKQFSGNPDQPGTLTQTGVLQLNQFLYEEELTHDTVTGDIDVYDFEALAGQSLTIHVRMDYLPEFDYRLLDSNGNVLLSGSQQGSNFELFTLDYDVAQTGQYFFEMERPNHSSSTGTYQIALREDIHADDQSTVGVIDFIAGQITGTTSSDSDHDWFAFTVEAGTQVFFENISGPSAGTTFNVSFKVYDANGNEIASDNPDNLFDIFSATLAEGGTYYLDILGQAPFVYQVSAQAIQGDVPGDASTTATIALDGPLVTSSFGGDGESDWFAFYVTAGELVEFSADANEAVIEIVNASGELIASYSGATNYLLHEFAESGTFYVSVTSFGTDQFVYELRGRSVVDDFGNSPNDAGSIGFDGVSINSALNFVGDEDWLSFSATAGQILYFNSIPGSPDFLHQANIVDAQGNLLVASSSRGESGRTHVTFEAPDDGTYYVQLIELASDAVGSYSISGHVLTDEEGNAAATAATISTNLFPENGTLELLSDVDLFEFEHDGQGALLYSITTNGLNFDDLTGFIQVNLDVVDATGTIISNDGLLVADAGTYYLRVSQDSEFSTGDVINYEVSISSIEDDFAGDATTSGVITPGGSAALGTLDFSGDVDWFALNASAGDNIYLLLQTENRSFENVQMQIFNPDGTTDGALFSFNAFASEFLLEAQQSGTYYVAVMSSQTTGADNKGAYSLNATALDGADPSGQSVDTALQLDFGTRIAAEITFGSSAENEDRDYFSFEAIAGQTLSFDMLSLGLEAPVYWLVDSAGEQITTVLEGSTTLTINETGNYFVVATSALFNDLGAYSIGITDLNAEIPPASRGADSIQGTSQNDMIDGLAGNDEIFGLAGNDSITGGLGNDLIDGGEGIDTIVYIDGSAEDFNIIELSEGRFRVESTLYGIDIVSNVEFLSIAGQQSVLRADPVTLTEFSDEFIGTNSSNIVSGLGGDDTINGRGGDDEIFGGDGSDNLQGGDGNDLISGGRQDDIIDGGLGDDRIDGGEGSDTISFDGALSGIVLDLSITEAQDTVGYGLDTIVNVENVIGSTQDDKIIGDVNDNRLSTLAGNDTLLGGESLELTATEAQVYRIYQAMLDRAPDAAGLAGWVSQIESGAQSLLQVIEGFTGSQEFLNVYGALGDDAFVELLYNNVLGRASDATGLQGWLDFIDSGGMRAEVVRGFSESAEFITNTEYAGAAWATHVQLGDVEGQIYRLYQATLDRAPDTAGFQGWVEIIEDGSSLLDIIPGFVNSAEFQNVYGSLDDTAFVDLLYNNVLGRSADAAGLQGWLDFMDGGGTRAEVVRGFSESAEFINGSAGALVDFMQTINTDWNDTLIGGADNDILFGGRGADRFIFDADEDGADTVYGLEDWDIIEMNGFGYTSANDFAAFLTQSGSDVLFSDQGVSITFINTDVATVRSLYDGDLSSSPASASLTSKESKSTDLQNTNAMDGMLISADTSPFHELLVDGMKYDILGPDELNDVVRLLTADDYWELA